MKTIEDTENNIWIRHNDDFTGKVSITWRAGKGQFERSFSAEKLLEGKKINNIPMSIACRAIALFVNAYWYSRASW